MSKQYEGDQDYVTNEKPLSKIDGYWKILFRILTFIMIVVTLPKILGISYEEMYNKLF